MSPSLSLTSGGGGGEAGAAAAAGRPAYAHRADGLKFGEAVLVRVRTPSTRPSSHRWNIGEVARRRAAVEHPVGVLLDLVVRGACVEITLNAPPPATTNGVSLPSRIEPGAMLNSRCPRHVRIQRRQSN
jgi:hypothetical protein